MVEAFALRKDLPEFSNVLAEIGEANFLFEIKDFAHSLFKMC